MQGFQYQAAIQDFRRARRRASLEKIMAFLQGKSADLLSYEEVRKSIKATGFKTRGLTEIPLHAIVGSVGRYTDFTRSFLPTQDSDEHRWSKIQAMMTGLGGLPPIEVFQIGEVYFVADGNHRVSVARQLGSNYIEAYVTEIQSKIPLSPDVQPDDLIIKAEYVDFLEHTHLDRLRPEADLTITVPGKYCQLEEHIEVHRYFMGLEQQRAISYNKAVTHWYDKVYLPVVTIIQDRGLLRDFPGRTLTDLYLWLGEHRAELERQLGWRISSEDVVLDLANRYSSKPERILARVSEKILDAVTPDEFESGPSPGTWRKEKLTVRRKDCLFCSILVPVNGTKSGWYALDQAIQIARREQGQLYGLHVVSEEQYDNHAGAAVKEKFEARCRAAGLQGKCVVEVGNITRTICDRARWADLVVMNLAHPPKPEPLSKLKSGFRTILQRCPRPILAVPQPSTPMRSALLAYDGSRKADEALFISAYLAGQWHIDLTVITVTEMGRTSKEILSLARDYLSRRNVEAKFIRERGSVSDAILATAEQNQCDFLMMGGYGYSPILEVVLGSKINEVLRQSEYPMLICR